MRAPDPERTLRRIKASPLAAVGRIFLAAGEQLAQRRSTRFAMRSSAVAMLASVIGYGLLAGDHLTDPSSGTRGLPAQISSYFGYAAEEVRIHGLQRMPPEAVLKAIGVMPGGSLLGFDANHARRILLNLDWVKQASVRVLPPNRLEVDVTEREPFAVWQRDGLYYVIDREGTAMASFDARRFANLMLVSGDGAQEEVSQLVNQLEAWPGLQSKVKAAARVGNRRWTLHFAGGRRALLPEKGVETALARLADLEARHQVLESGIREIDLRIADSAVLVPFDTAPDKTGEKVAARQN
jgi:cell division protein FtsQ